jgi:rSAM/selenodomain-associated transferase 1
VNPAIIVIAKAPRPGRVKTRLCPPLRYEEAALLAGAALRDTLRAALDAAPGRVTLALDGAVGPWLRGFDVPVIPQRGDDLSARIGAAFADVSGTAALIGMDTPQVTAVHLTRVLDALMRDDAVLGECDDGGFWVVGVRNPRASMFEGVPMSRADTAAEQRARLRAHGLRVVTVDRMRDVDRIADAYAVAHAAPTTEFASVLEQLALPTAVGA